MIHTIKRMMKKFKPKIHLIGIQMIDIFKNPLEIHRIADHLTRNMKKKIQLIIKKI